LADLKLENVLFTHSTLRKERVHHAGKTIEVEVPANTNIKGTIPQKQVCNDLLIFCHALNMSFLGCFNCCWCAVRFCVLILMCALCLHSICASLTVIDFGGATYEDDRSKARIINTRQYRGPEVTLELGWSYPSDMWSAGCIVAEVRY
jgi:serine/threonine protein kinase